ncbi:MAG: AMP-binding protein, partial [Solirubrobacterales bacterium]|nr:AMP-binding protein [Solirubrobacterales bacterium]
MESQTAPATGTAVDAANLAQALHLTAASHPDVVAVRSVDDAVSWTWAELEERAAKLAAGLAGLGVGHGDMVALMLTNRPEFFLCDLAALTLGAVPFSIYNTYPPDQIAFLVKDSGARVIVTEQAFLSRVLEVKRELPSLEHVLVADAPGADAPTGTMSLATVEGHAPAAFDVSAARAAVAPDDLATLIYTSGTTGPPKGVELTHANLMAAASSVEEIMDFEPGSRVISWLPAAHIAERMANYYIPLVFGGTVTVCPDPREIASFLPQVRPNWFFAVPRIWEKLKAGLETMLAAQEPSARLP